MKFGFAAGVSIYKLSDTEVIASGSARTMILEGPVEILLEFFSLYSDGSELDLGQAISIIAQSRKEIPFEEISTGLKDVAERLLADGIFATKDKTKSMINYKKIVVLTHCISSGIKYLLDSLGNTKIKICTIDKNNDEIINGYNNIIFPGWDDLISLTPEITEDCLLVAVGLSNSELHKINKIAVEQRFKWLYVALSGTRAVVSSIYSHRKSPCFACARLRRLGSVDDIFTGAMLEANLLRDLPIHQTTESIDTASDLVLAGLITQKLHNTTQNNLHIMNKTNMEISQVAMTRLVDCPVCGGM